MSVVLQISDPHFGTEQKPVVAALLQLHAQLQPDAVVVSGDITQRARRSQFRAARDFFTALNPRAFVIVPGNHDIPLFNLALRAFAPYANYASAFGKNLQPDFVSDDLLIIGLNTTRPRRHTDGEVSARQIAYVQQRLRAARATQLRIVLIHQPVHVITVLDETNLLHGYRKAIQAWGEAGADLIMGGHIHLPYVRALQHGDRKIWAVQAGTALSSRVRGGVPNSVNVVRYRGDAAHRECSIEQWDFDLRSGTFRMALRTAVDLSSTF